MWILLVLVLVAMILLGIRTKSGNKSNGGQTIERVKDQSMAETVLATITRKDISTPSKPQPTFYYVSTQNRPHGAKIFGVLTIKIHEGKEKKFNVSEKDFCKVTEGDVGKLTYLGNHFIHFELLSETELENDLLL